MFRNKSVDVHQFAMVPRADVPRSTFHIQTTHKTTFDAGWLIPVYCDEVLPGDSFNVRMTAFARLSTPIVPIMDNLHLDSFFFFVPNRLVWDNWKRFMGEQAAPGATISYVVPQTVGPLGGYQALTLHDYFGLPVAGQVNSAGFVSHSNLPLRAYNLIFNEWFRDENLIASVPVDKGDGPDTYTDYVLLKRGKRHDYFTSALPWPQKGGSVAIPLGDSAPVFASQQGPGQWLLASGGVSPDGAAGQTSGDSSVGTAPVYYDPRGSLFADLSAASAATINQLRQSFQVQKLLERDARGGTRYTEIVRAHFGVVSPDARLQRPEYLGGGSTAINISPIAQTSGTAGAGGYTDTPQGHLAAIGTSVAQGHGFSQSFTEHGHVIGLVCVRADLTYQQGMRRMWSRSTRYDFYFPAFAHLGEQTILNKEIYVQGLAADNDVFGYQERWSEYRYNPAMITGLFRSTLANTLDVWHLAQHFTSLPTLSQSFIEENPPLERVLAVGAGAGGQQLIFDSFFDIKAARPLPMYSVPGLIDHF